METSKTQHSRGRGGGRGAGNNQTANGGGSNRHHDHRPSGAHGSGSGGGSGNSRYIRDNKNSNKTKIKDRTDHNGIPMSESREECILCCQNSDIFGIGTCRHPACLECAIRMRCQGQMTTCHACREEVPIMFFVNRLPDVNWSTFQIPNCAVPHPDLRKHGIAFEEPHVAMCYDKLIAFSCPVCSKRGQFAEFPTFAALKQHIGTHQLFYCHICHENLNLLPKDREIYTSKELQSHITEHHPICRFCNERYYDGEALFVHSRKNHFFCTLCAQETGANTFFSRIEQVHRHYKTAHHPCLDPNCVSLGIVFRDEMDLNAHKIEQHGGTDRNVQIDFQFSRNSSRYGSPPRRLADHSSAGITIGPSTHPHREPPTNIIPSAQFSGQPVNLVPPPSVRQADFPSLAPSSQAFTGSNWRSDVQAARNRSAGNAEPSVQQQLGSTNHFPTLSGAPSSSNATAAGVWGQGKVNEKIKQPPRPPVEKKKVEVEPQRKRIIPLPQVWPENMRRKLEARELGLPEPPDDFPALPIVSKKKKEPKKKTVSAESVKKRMDEQKTAATTSSTSKFNALAAVGSQSDDPSLDAWLSSTAMKAKQKKADKKKAEKEAREEVKRKEAEEEEAKKKERLTHEKFMAEIAEANRKLLEQEQQKEADRKFLEEHADDLRAGNSSSENDPMLELLMQQFKTHSTSVRTEEDRQNARVEAILGPGFNDKNRPSHTTIQRETQLSDEPSGSGLSHRPLNQEVPMPPPGFESLGPPPGLGNVPPGLM